jgi:predicted  nucleic acid-binding Zn-ribbon protein
MDRAKADLKRIDNEIPKLKNRIGQIKTELEGLSPMWFLRVRRLKQERDNLNQRLAKLQRKRPGVHRLAVQNCVEEAIEIARKRDHQLMYVKAELKKDNEQADILGQAERELKEQLAAAKLAVAEAFERLRIAKMSPAEHVAGQLLSEANFELIEDLSLPHSLVESEAEQRSSMERPRGG